MHEDTANGIRWILLCLGCGIFGFTIGAAIFSDLTAEPPLLEALVNTDAGVVCFRSYAPAQGLACLPLLDITGEDVDVESMLPSFSTTVGDTLIPVAWLRSVQDSLPLLHRYQQLYWKEVTRTGGSR